MWVWCGFLLTEMQTLYISSKEGPQVIFAELDFLLPHHQSRIGREALGQFAFIHLLQRPIFHHSQGTVTPEARLAQPGLPHLPGDRSQQSSTARLPPCGQLVKEKGEAEFSPCLHCIGAALEASAVFVSGTGSSPGLFCLL